MKYHFELNLIVRTEVSNPKGVVLDTKSIDTIIDTNLVGLLAQFLIVLASVHKRILSDLKLERQIIDDDIPF